MITPISNSQPLSKKLDMDSLGSPPAFKGKAKRISPVPSIHLSAT